MLQFYSPNRRELTLIFFSVMIFVVFYNFEATFDSFANPNSARTSSNPSPDGIHLDVDIYGDWAVEDSHVSSIHEQYQQQNDTTDPVVWLTGEFVSEAHKQIIFGNIGVNDGFMHWDREIPQTQLLKHIAGFSIMDNVIACNGTLFIVTDSPSSFPPLGSIASFVSNSQEPPHLEEWQMLSVEQARDKLGSYGGLIQGVSWLSYDTTPSNYTLFSLWRIYSSLDNQTSPGQQPSFPLPRRLFFPNIPTLKGPPLDRSDPTPRFRSDSGFHPYLPKAAFPMLGLMYKEDWQDYALMNVPFVLEKVVVADLGAAGRSRNDVPPFALPLVGLDASKEWWEPIRQNLVNFLNVDRHTQNSISGTEKTIVTYISRQDADDGPNLRRADHDALVRALEELRKSDNFEVYIVSSEGNWKERLSAVAQSTVVMGVYGDSLADSLFLRPSGHSTLMEFFPSGVFNRNTELPLNSLGIQYIAWWNDQQFRGDSLPHVASGSDDGQELLIDATAVVETIRQLVAHT